MSRHGLPLSFGNRTALLAPLFAGRVAYRCILGLFAALICLSRVEATPEKIGEFDGALLSIQAGPERPSPALLPVYRIKLRVHLANSGRRPQEFEPIFAEINTIWLTQAGICFEIHTVGHDTALTDGLDMWFAPDIGGYNGYFDGESIHMSDAPVLAPAAHPAKSSAARTAAHELGHALDLSHRQDSDDNLMRSRTYGWQLNTREALHARTTAADLAIEDFLPSNCGPPKIGPSEDSSARNENLDSLPEVPPPLLNDSEPAR